MISWFTAVLNTAVIAAPMMRKKATSRKSAVADWMASRTRFAGLDAAASAAKSCVSPGAAATLRPARWCAGEFPRAAGVSSMVRGICRTMRPTATAMAKPMPSRSAVISNGFCPLNAAKVLNATMGLTMGAPSM